MSSSNSLRSRLDRLARAYGPDRLEGDPLSLVHRYSERDDLETAGLVAATLAFGNARQVIRSASSVLEALGPRPARGLEDQGFVRKLSGFRHRWVDGGDAAALLRSIRLILDRWGTVEAFFLDGHESGDIRTGLSSFSKRARSLGGRRRRGFHYLLPDAASGSAVKRLCLFLRWMVRPADGIDLGLWTGVRPRELVIPLDTHVLRISRYIGLTERKTATWRTAEEITAALARLCPSDPVRYDFAIAQLGISRGCLHRRVPERCGECPLETICRL